MTMARVCECCSIAITTEDYYDLMLALKNPAESPEQDAECVDGDFCRACVISGDATRKLLHDYEAKECVDIRAELKLPADPPHPETHHDKG